MARPRTDRRIQRVVRLTAEEDQMVTNQAQELGVSPSAYLRQAGLKKLPRRRGNGVLDPEVQRDVWKQVSGMARNLNQLTKHVHSGALKEGELEGLRGEVGALVRWVIEAQS